MRVLLVGDQQFQESAREGVAEHAHIRVYYQTDIAEEAREVCQDAPPDVIVIDEDMLNALQVCSKLAKAAPKSIVILAAKKPTPDLIKKATAYGARDIVRKPLDGYELTKAVDSIRSVFQDRSRQLDDEDEEGGNSANVGPSRFLLQSVIAVHSPKGGVGKTSVALNLAIQYILSGGKDVRVALVDFDPYGTLVGSLQMEGKADITQWMELTREPTLAEIEGELTCVHKPSGLRIIPSPRTLADAETRIIEHKHADMILRSLRKHFHVVVVDCGPRLQDAQILALEQATRVIEVVLPEVPTLRAMNDLRDFVEALQIPTAKFGCVINRVPKKLTIPKGEIRDHLPWPQIAEIPDDPVVSEAVNSGKVIVKDFPDSTFAQVIRKLAGETTMTSGPKHQSFLGKLLAKFKS